MSYKLFIVESPKKCHTIGGYLGEGYIIKASMGHIREIPPNGINIDIENNFEPKFEIIDGKSNTINELKQLANKADEILLATDPDREGEAISWHIAEVIGEKNKGKCKRVTFHEIKKAAILNAIKNPRQIDQSLVDAQRARQVLDRLIGYKISPVLWRTVANKTSAGRVQSIALKLICDRQKEIDNFKTEVFWYVDANLNTEKNDKFTARTVTDDKDNRFKDEKLVLKAKSELEKAKYFVKSVEKSEKKASPPPPFDTTSLQKSCSAIFGWNLTKTMRVAQSLYEAGKISYLRTDSYNISEEALVDVRKYISSVSDKPYLPSSPNHYKKKSSAAAQEAHECIRPTDVTDCGDDLSDDDDKKMYDLIRARFIACQSTPMIIDATIINVGTDTQYKLIAKGQVIKFDGWSKFYPYRDTEENTLPDVKEKEQLDLIKLVVTRGETKPPPRYNDGTITEKMEKEGVGRPSTRAPIIKALQDKQYITIDKKAFVPTELGNRINDYLSPRFNDFFMDIKFTARLEEDLDLIADNKKKYLEVLQPFYELLKSKVKTCQADKKEQKSMGQKCNVCGKAEILEKYGKFGVFYACGNYPECKTAFVKNEDGTFSVKQAPKQEKTGEKCSVCKKGNIVKKSGKYGEFYACDAYPDCKSIFEKNGDVFSIKKKGNYATHK